MTDQEWLAWGYVTEDPCRICGAHGDNRLEPRFQYVICREHAYVKPADLDRVRAKLEHARQLYPKMFAIKNPEESLKSYATGRLAGYLMESENRQLLEALVLTVARRDARVTLGEGELDLGLLAVIRGKLLEHVAPLKTAPGSGLGLAVLMIEFGLHAVDWPRLLDTLRALRASVTLPEDAT